MKNLISIVSITLVFILAAAGAAIAQSGDRQSVHNPDSDSRALMFGMGSNLDITSFRGGVFSYKWFTGPSKAHRITTDLGFMYMSGDETQTTNATLSEEQDLIESDIRLNYDILFYNEVTRSVYSYWGVGPTLSYAFRDSELTQTSTIGTSSMSSRYEESSSEFGVGASFTIGAEWFVHPAISISTEYALNLSVNFLSFESETTTGITDINPGSTTDRDSNITSFDLGGSGARVGISVYF